MKSTIIASAAAAAALCAVSANAADATVGVDFKTAYLATGATINDAPVFCPWAEISGLKIGETALPFTLGFWGNMDLDEYDDDPEATDPGRFSEIDLNVDLDLGALWTPDEKFSWSIGYLEYDYPVGGYDTDNLVTFKAGYDCLLAPSFTCKYRIGGPSEQMYELCFALSHSLVIDEETLGGISLGLSADVWYVNYDDVDDTEKDSGFACSDFTASLNVGDFYVSGTYVAQWDDDTLPDGPYGYDVEWIGACGFSHTF